MGLGLFYCKIDQLPKHTGNCEADHDGHLEFKLVCISISARMMLILIIGFFHT